jgi:hypothetical protein
MVVAPFINRVQIPCLKVIDPIGGEPNKSVVGECPPSLILHLFTVSSISLSHNHANACASDKAPPDDSKYLTKS